MAPQNGHCTGGYRVVFGEHLAQLGVGLAALRSSDDFDFQRAVGEFAHNPAGGAAGSPTPQQLTHPSNSLITTNTAYGTYAVAPATIVSSYGSNLAAAVKQAPSQPLPTSLGGVTVTVTDANGGVFPALLIYVSPNQVNWLIPTGVATGTATVTLTNGTATFTGTALISSTAPGLYTANLTGQGPASAQVTDGANYSDTFQCNSSGICTLVPINVATQPFLMLYGTGIRGAAQPNVSVKIGNINAPVTYAGAQGGYAGLDQVNVSLPTTLKGRGQLVVTVSINGQASNMGQLLFQ
jgi:uncharacterized protein (TIGR03437 family)